MARNGTRIAIVAGAAGALGHATTVTLAASGSTVVAVDRNESGLHDLPANVRREVADPTDPAAVTKLIERIADEFGPPNALVNTIGAFVPADALDTTPDMLRSMIDVNLTPALWLSQAVAPHMRERGSGAIVHVAARPDVELRPYGIRVNAVAPQLIDTAANRAAFPPDAMTKAVAPEAIVDVIAFLV